MRVAVVGSRDYPKLPKVAEFVRTLPPETIVLSGGASGVDEAAERAARAFGLKFIPFTVDTIGLPEDETARRIEYGKRAYQRTTRMVERAETVAAFWTVCSRPQCLRPKPHRTHGTDHAITEAKRLRKPIRLIGPDGREVLR